jgi:ribosomal protein L15E
LFDRPHHGVVPSWPLWASRGSGKRPRSKGERIVDPTCRRSNVTSATRQGTMRGIAGQRPNAAAINLEVVKSARTTTAGNEEPSEEQGKRPPKENAHQRRGLQGRGTHLPLQGSV